MTALVHPISGEVLPDDVAALRAALDAMDGPYRAARLIRERVAELETVDLPHPVRQSDKQRRVSACPRCGMRQS